MGRVYRARHEFLDRQHAVKILRAKEAHRERSRARFHREALVASRIEHPNIVKLDDYGVAPAGFPFLVMEWVEGVSLETLIATDGPFDAVRTARISRQIADALAAIHDKGFVHRDLKPANVVIGSDADSGRDHVTLLDFGLVRVVGDGLDSAGRLTRAGAAVGTPMYMPPELACGLPATDRSDLYTLGVVMFEMLAGAPPFDGQDVRSLLNAQISETIPPIPASIGLEAIIGRLLEKDPSARPPSAAAVVHAIDALGLERKHDGPTEPDEPVAHEGDDSPTVQSIDTTEPPTVKSRDVVSAAQIEAIKAARDPAQLESTVEGMDTVPPGSVVAGHSEPPAAGPSPASGSTSPADRPLPVPSGRGPGSDSPAAAELDGRSDVDAGRSAGGSSAATSSVAAPRRLGVVLTLLLVAGCLAFALAALRSCEDAGTAPTGASSAWAREKASRHG